MAKLNVTQAAKTAGIAKNTLYAHMEKGKVSYEIDEDGRKWIDSSELNRAYGQSGNGKVSNDRSDKRSVDHSRIPEIEHLYQQQIKALERENEGLRKDKEEGFKRDTELREILKQQTRLLEDKREITESTPLDGIKRWLRIGMISFNTLLILITLAMFIRLLELWYGVELVGRFF